MQEKWSFRREILRKALHMSSIFVVLLYLILKEYYSKEIALLSLLFILLLFMIYEIIRLKVKNIRLPFSDVARYKEKSKFTSGIYVIASILICFAVFDEKIAISAILMLIFGDVVVGLLRHKKNIKKSWNRRIYKSAIFVEFLVDFGLAWFVLEMFWVSFFMAAVAVASEAIFDSEDNLAIPIFSGFVGQMILLVM